jgi:hypothetical protein
MHKALGLITRTAKEKFKVKERKGGRKQSRRQERKRRMTPLGTD